MELTPISGVLIPLAVFSFVFAPDFLYWLMIFFLPFSATAVANIGTTGSASGLQAAILFGSLWVLRAGPLILQKSRFWKARYVKRLIRWLRFFMIIVVLSLIMPIWINGRLMIDCFDLSCNSSEPLIFSVKHISQTIYLFYGVIIMIFVGVRNIDTREFVKSIRIFLISAVFVSLWGGLQWYCYHAGLAYPAGIFNTSATESAQGYLQDIGDFGVTRISSVATEPSILAQYLLIAVVFALFAVVNKQILISRLWDRVALAVTTVVLLMTTSTTAYIGLGILVPTCLAGFWYLRRLSAKLVFSVLLSMTTLLVIYLQFGLVRQLTDIALLSKLETYSSFGRLNSILVAFTYFQAYPVLGIGWGSATSLDLIVKLLSNTGILGFATFALFVKSIFSALWRSLSRGQQAESTVSHRPVWACCLLASITVLLVTNELTGFAFTDGHVWFLFGLALSVPFLRDLTIPIETVTPRSAGA